MTRYAGGSPGPRREDMAKWFVPNATIRHDTTSRAFSIAPPKRVSVRSASDGNPAAPSVPRAGAVLRRSKREREVNRIKRQQPRAAAG